MRVGSLYSFTDICIYGYIADMPVSKRKKTSKKTTLSTLSAKVKTTILLEVSLKKLAQIYAVENDMTLQQVVEKALKKLLV